MHTNYMAASKALLLVVVSFGQLCDSLDLIGANLEGIALEKHSKSIDFISKTIVFIQGLRIGHVHIHLSI